MVGQERAIQALELGLNIKGNGYHIFASGLVGPKKLDVMASLIKKHLHNGKEPPKDLVYVNNFKNPDEPRAIFLNAGEGRELRSDMERLIEILTTDLPEAFRQEKFEKEKRQIAESFQEKVKQLGEALEKEAAEKDMILQRAPDGEFFFVPAIDGKPLKSPEEFEQLPEEKRKQFEQSQQELMKKLKEFLSKQQSLLRELAKTIKEVEQQFAKDFIAPIIFEIGKKYKQREVKEYLADVERHILEHLDQFKMGNEEQAPAPFPMPPWMKPPKDEDRFLEYRVNLLVDNSELKGSPVVVEDSPTYKNLFGTIERVVDRHGRLVTNFTRIKPGAILRANGGVLIINLDDAIFEPYVWRWLLRTLKNNRISIDTYDPWSLFSTSGIKPEPVEINVKVVLLGSAYLYHLLYNLEREFPELFSIRADFAPDMPFTKENAMVCARHIAYVAEEENLPPFTKGAIAKLLEYSARAAGDRQKLLAQMPYLADIAREAAFWAEKENLTQITEREISYAIQQRRFRNSRIEERINDMIIEDTIKIATEGVAVGQINGLAVYSLAGYSFGKPSRITASVGKGMKGIINIEREAKLSGSIHDKGVLILSGYLQQKYGRTQQLQLTASITFEQNYGGIDGDSASSTELYALISAISGIPLRQDIAVTGSIDQKGEIQAIGGVNEKIEGFFKVCKARGLTGTQGVMIPQSNVKNLILSDEVLSAISKGKFHIYAISTIDEGIEILTGIPAGDIKKRGTVHYKVMNELKKLAAKPATKQKTTTSSTKKENEETSSTIQKKETKKKETDKSKKQKKSTSKESKKKKTTKKEDSKKKKKGSK